MRVISKEYPPERSYKVIPYSYENLNGNKVTIYVCFPENETDYLELISIYSGNYIDDDLWLDTDYPIDVLPDHLTVTGSMNIYSNKISKTPNNLTVGKNLFLFDGIKELGDNLTVAGYCDIYSNAISKLPHNMKVGENLDLSCTSITEIPEDLVIKYP